MQLARYAFAGPAESIVEAFVVSARCFDLQARFVLLISNCCPLLRTIVHNNVRSNNWRVSSLVSRTLPIVSIYSLNHGGMCQPMRSINVMR